MVVLVYVPHSSTLGYLFPTSLSAFIVFCTISMLTGVRWNLFVVFNLHFLMLAILRAFHVSVADLNLPFEKGPFMFFLHFLNGLCVLLLLSISHSLYILATLSFVDYSSIIFHCVDCLVTLLKVSFAVGCVLTWCNSFFFLFLNLLPVFLGSFWRR